MSDRIRTAVLCAAPVAAGDATAPTGFRQMVVDRIAPVVATTRADPVDRADGGIAAFFVSADAAWQAAVLMQTAGRSDLRIGIHVGVVTHHGASASGPDIDLAAGLERLARPGGICLSAAAQAQMRLIPDRLAPSGLRTIDGVAHVVPVWHWPGALPRD